MDDNTLSALHMEIERAKALRQIAAEHRFDIQMLVADFEQTAKRVRERIAGITPRQ